MSDYPVQLEKVQAPPLREETLARDRLLDWLNVQIHRRVVLVLAEAGYGKTTLLADFSRRTRIRVAWYRLDRGDRDWLGFLAHLVAALRIHEPDFGPATHSLIREASAGTTPREAVLDTFLRELAALPPEPLAFVFDDVHLVEESPDARVILRELLARAPERMSFVLVSRAAPPLSLARLRARGEVAELKTADLRFAPDETERLFRDTFAIPLEPAVLAELASRTEGWIASLQLVRAAIRDRNQVEIRAFVRSLSGAEGDLYDYLAEEVVGELPIEMQHFLMRTALLEVVEPVLAGVAAGSTIRQTRAAIDEGEVLGLFSRIGPGRRDQVRAHPLVRDFLEARLHRSIGMDAVREIHRAIAAAAEPLDWRIAGHHYLAAGSLTDARRVLAASIEIILATGAYAAAEELATALDAPGRVDTNVLIVQSRMAQRKGDLAAGVALARAAWDSDHDSASASLSLQSALMNSGDIPGSVQMAKIVESRAEWGSLARISRATRLLLETSNDGEIGEAVRALRAVVEEFEPRGPTHFAGVAYMSLGALHYAANQTSRSLECVDAAISHLSATSASHELVSARLLRAVVLAHEGRLTEARVEAAAAAESATDAQTIEVAFETAWLEVLYGDPSRAASLLAPWRGRLDGRHDVEEQALAVQTLADLAVGTVPQGLSIDLHAGELRSTVAMESIRRFVGALQTALIGDEGRQRAESARRFAEAQGARLWGLASALLLALATRHAGHVVHEVAATAPVALTIATDAVVSRWSELDPRTRDLARSEAQRRPDRWRASIRQAIPSGSPEARIELASILDEIGAIDDVARLRRLARELKGAGLKDLGRGLARRLAARVWIEDLGRVQIRVGDRVVDGRTVRRKVMALLCYLLTRPKMASTKEEVLDVLWPSLDPGVALNSLNQTVYFLRRVFEPTYVEDTSPGYVGQDGELIWLDAELIRSTSQGCRALIRSYSLDGASSRALDLVRAYSGRFATDFTYEDWATDYRDSLHTSYLRVVERAIEADLASGHYDRGIELVEEALQVAPDADELQIAHLRLLRLAGSPAAAAEQYAHYLRVQRDLGAEPEPLERLVQSGGDR